MNGPSSPSQDRLGAAPESAADETLQTLARYRVTIDCPDHIRAYLRRYPGLIPHLVPTAEQARQAFGDLAQLTLTINDDPEAFDPYLKMYLSLPKYGPDTLAGINRIQELLDEATAGQEGFFLVTTDHRIVGG
jgi:hypothetical protein